MEQRFNKDAFMEYMRNTFQCFENHFVWDLVENVIDYASKYEHISKDQFVYFVSDILPEVEFGEVAAFVDDECLTDNGKYMKYKWMNDHGMY